MYHEKVESRSASDIYVVELPLPHSGEAEKRSAETYPNCLKGQVRDSMDGKAVVEGLGTMLYSKKIKLGLDINCCDLLHALLLSAHFTQ